MMELGAVEAATRGGMPGLEPDRRCGTCRWLHGAQDFSVPAHGGHVRFSAGLCGLSMTDEPAVVGEYDEACARWEEWG